VHTAEARLRGFEGASSAFGDPEFVVSLDRRTRVKDRKEATLSSQQHHTLTSSLNQHGAGTMIYNMYIFDRHCQCIYYHDWHRGHIGRGAFDQNGDPLASHHSASGGAGGSTTTTMTDPRQGMNMSLEEEGKLVYGVVFSLRNLVKKLGTRYALRA